MQTQDRVEKIKHSLELDEQLNHQIKGWKVQRVCGALIIIVIILTVLGLFGNGPLSLVKAVRKGTALQYQRFLRYENETDIQWRVSGQDTIRLLIPMRYLDYFKVEKIVPDGYESSISNGNVSYTFHTDRTAENIIHVYLIPQQAGNISGTWQINEQDFKVTHFIYP
ncbi:hypothetical protein [Parapedobacter sp. DT-150]|uniref:hypothetical protein n=1 Tax=Parapedobacter sp. DT-150 TaxID=3396162 RepID=UPI003F1A076F